MGTDEAGELRSGAKPGQAITEAYIMSRRIEVERLVPKTHWARCPFDFAQDPEPVEGGTMRSTNVTSFRKIQ